MFFFPSFSVQVKFSYILLLLEYSDPRKTFLLCGYSFLYWTANISIDILLSFLEGKDQHVIFRYFSIAVITMQYFYYFWMVSPFLQASVLPDFVAYAIVKKLDMCVHTLLLIFNCQETFGFCLSGYLCTSALWDSLSSKNQSLIVY